MIIKVTKQDIAKGVPGHSDACPVARALKRAGFRAVRAGLFTINAQGRKTFPTPASLAEFMNNFDAGLAETLEPLTFEIPWRKPVKKATKK
jgi:hypothetical protein